LDFILSVDDTGAQATIEDEKTETTCLSVETIANIQEAIVVGISAGETLFTYQYL